MAVNQWAGSGQLRGDKMQVKENILAFLGLPDQFGLVLLTLSLILALAACRRELFDHRLRRIVHLAYEQKIQNRRLRSNTQFYRHVARMLTA